MDERLRLKSILVRMVRELGHPEQLGVLVAENLRTENAMKRMIGYLCHAQGLGAEDIADEMLAIMEERERFIRKKTSEYYNSKLNELVNSELGEE